MNEEQREPGPSLELEASRTNGNKRTDEAQRAAQGTTPRRPRRSLTLAFAVIAALVVALALGTIVIAFNQPNPPVTVTTFVFTQDKVFATPSELAMGGQPVILDPTGQHIAYGVAGQAGEIYTTDLNDPIARNKLAVRFARDISWAPDGSALVTTIYPSNASLPLLAVASDGQYIHVPGTQALAASWLPSSATTITYITESNGQATLWESAPDGLNTHIASTIPLSSSIAQHMSWSPDGHYLAILAAPGSSPTRNLLQGPGRVLYLFDTRTKSIVEFVPPAGSAITELAWSHDGRMLTYEQIDARGHATLYTIDATTQQALFSIALQSSLLGMSWSPDNSALIYSDGGTLRAHVVSGPPISFNGIKGMAAYPSWLDGKHILYLSIVNGRGQLTQLGGRVSQA